MKRKEEKRGGGGCVECNIIMEVTSDECFSMDRGKHFLEKKKVFFATDVEALIFVNLRISVCCNLQIRNDFRVLIRGRSSG